MSRTTSSNVSTNPVVAALQFLVKQDPTFEKQLLKSLSKAQQKGEKQLDSDLYAALDWPLTFADYVTYLEEFARWGPQQSDSPAWLADPENRQYPDEHQEVYDRLCHFYFLIDQRVGGKIAENYGWFSEWLVAYAADWGQFLNTTASWSQDQLESFINDSPEYRVQDSMTDGRPNAPSGWLTFNQFFARELNPGLRPISTPYDNTLVVSPADCTYRKSYAIGANSEIKKIRIKGTHTVANINDLLEGSEYADSFANGTFVHYFLGPYSYHRFHTPVAGEVMESYAIQGKVFLDVRLSRKSGQFNAPDSSQGGYEFNQARGVITIDTSKSDYGDIGIVAVIPVGMCQVSSVNMTATPGTNCLKGDEFGYFLFGGSDIIVLFQEGTNPELDKGGHYRHYGTPIATCTTGC